MSVIVIILVLIGLYAAVRLVASILSAVAGGRYRAYQALAGRYKGRYESRGLVDPPTVSFPHRGAAIRVGLAPMVAGQSNPPRTRIVARFAEGLPFRLELFPSLRPPPPQLPRGTRAVRVGDPAIDHRYQVRTNDADLARLLLVGPQVVQVLDALGRLAPPGGFLVTVNNERLLIQVDRDLGVSVQGLEQLVVQGLTLHDRLVDLVGARLAEGVAIVDVGEAAPDDGGPPACKVCGDPIVGPHVRCSACKTPHHEDCWRFVGGCSIYGCQGKQSTPIASGLGPPGPPA